MVFIPDLHRDHPLKQSHADTLPVGYLEAGHEYERGEVDVRVIDRLIEFSDWRDFLSDRLGLHWCSLCAAENLYGPDCRSSQRSICVPGEGVFYETSTWIMHYIISHGYRPPDEFCTAVLAAQAPISLQDMPEKPRWWLSRILNTELGPKTSIKPYPSTSWECLYPCINSGCEKRLLDRFEQTSGEQPFVPQLPGLPESRDDTPAGGVDFAKLQWLEEHLISEHGGCLNVVCGRPGCEERCIEGLTKCLRHAYPLFDFVEEYALRHGRLPWETSEEGQI